MAIKKGSRVRFWATLSNGGTATWTAQVVAVTDDGIALVRHPERARTFPFSPVQEVGLYRYEAAKLKEVPE